MKFVNEMRLVVPSISANESFVRSTVAAFSVSLNPTIEEINDIKTAVSEAVTNSVVHGYKRENVGMIEIWAGLLDDEIWMEISDKGVGIADVQKALQPFFTTRAHEERSGMGFTVMEAFMDSVVVTSELGSGTKIEMKKKIEKSPKGDVDA